MRRWVMMLVLVGMLVALMGCANWPFEPYRAALIEAEFHQVADCEQVGALSETVDAAKIITPLARRRMIEKLESRAQALGATHLVWLYRTDQTAAARVFRCTE